VEEWGYLNASSNGIAAMQNEIMKRGPIVCSMQTEDDTKGGWWHCYDGSTVYRTKNKFTTTNHVINLLGWGSDASGVDYWVGRHSGGTIWGEEGFFKIERGVNALNIESHCGWATVADAFPLRDSKRVACEDGKGPHIGPPQPVPPFYHHSS
jgi:hypothetical protein